MSIRNWIGCLVIAVTFGLTGVYLHHQQTLTVVPALFFGGGLVFGGWLLDEEGFPVLGTALASIIRAIRGDK